MENVFYKTLIKDDTFFLVNAPVMNQIVKASTPHVVTFSKQRASLRLTSHHDLSCRVQAQFVPNPAPLCRMYLLSPVSFLSVSCIERVAPCSQISCL